MELKYAILSMLLERELMEAPTAMLFFATEGVITL
jgi:hypothetical protein